MVYIFGAGGHTKQCIDIFINNDKKFIENLNNDIIILINGVNNKLNNKPNNSNNISIICHNAIKNSVNTFDILIIYYY